MAKTRNETSAAGGGPARDKVSMEEARLRAYHALGEKVVALLKGAKLDADTLQKLHEETGYGFDAIRKARVFAKVYTKVQLDELCKLRTPEEGLRAGMPLSWRLVRVLLMLPPGEGRESLQRKVAEKGWTLEELIAAVPKRVRDRQTRRGGGRGFRRPKTKTGGLRQVVWYGEAWLRRYRKAWEGFDWTGSKPGAAGPGGQGARVAEARQTLKKLGQAVKRLDARLRELEREQAGGPGTSQG